jgi:TolB-like protein/Tfp pilus assembly protein PilF
VKVEEKNSASLTIDLDQFKLFLESPETGKLTLHFDTPSRRFYLSVIAFVVEQMREGAASAVPLKDHSSTLAVLNETVGGGVGSSEESKLLRRIYKKWRSDLPDLEKAPLFLVVGRTKEFGDAPGKGYRFGDGIKDAWANLFEYQGSLENVRLRFSVEKLGIRLEDVAIRSGNRSGADQRKAWERFIQGLRQALKETHAKGAGHDGRASRPDPVKKDGNGERPENTVSAKDSGGNRHGTETEASPAPAVRGPSGGGRGGEPPTESFRAATGKRGPAKSWKKRLFILIPGLLVLFAALALWKLQLSPGHKPDATVPGAHLSPEASPAASVAVLPFANLSGDPSEDYLGDGITEQIITALSKTPKMKVIARNSVLAYQGKPVTVQQIGEELGVRYVLEGSVQKSGNRLRIAAQLVNAETGNYVWTELYDRELNDLFAIQDEITMNVIGGLRVTLTEGEQGRIYSRGTNNIHAYLKALKGYDLLARFRSKEDSANARRLFEEAIALDPEYVGAYVMLAFTHYHDSVFHWSKTPGKSLERALETAQKALELDESDPSVHSVLECIYTRMGLLDKALAEGKRAIELSPNGAEANAFHCLTLLALGRNEEALAAINKAMRLNPISPKWYFVLQGDAHRNMGRYVEALASYKKALHIDPNAQHALVGLGVTYTMMGQYEAAIEAFKREIRFNPDFLSARVALSATYALSGQEKKALDEAKEVLRIDPEFTIDGFAKAFLAGDETGKRKTMITTLGKAGLK